MELKDLFDVMHYHNEMLEIEIIDGMHGNNIIYDGKYVDVPYKILTSYGYYEVLNFWINTNSKLVIHVKNIYNKNRYSKGYVTYER